MLIQSRDWYFEITLKIKQIKVLKCIGFERIIEAAQHDPDPNVEFPFVY